MVKTENTKTAINEGRLYSKTIREKNFSFFDSDKFRNCERSVLFNVREQCATEINNNLYGVKNLDKILAGLLSLPNHKTLLF